MSTSSASAGLGLLAAASWGGSDFIGGLGSRRASPLLITVSGQAASLVILAAVCRVLHAPLPGIRVAALSAVAGFEAALALVVFYRLLAMGAMGLTAALTGLVTALVPVAFSIFNYGLPTMVTLSGLALGCAAIWLITHQRAQSSKAVRPRALLLSVLAGAGFGSQLILFKLAETASGLSAANSSSNAAIPATAGILVIMAAARAAGVAVLLIVLIASRTPLRGQHFWKAGIAAGLLDTGGNLLFLAAVRFGRLDAAAVVCSLYPVGTILLAAVVLRERPTPRQWAGMALALGAVALLSL